MKIEQENLMSNIPLIGTERQQVFARNIIKKLLDNYEMEVALIASSVLLSKREYPADEDAHNTTIEKIQKIVFKILRVKKNSTWWIHHKDDFWKRLEKYVLDRKIYEQS